MTEYEWPVIRAKCDEWFGSTPSKPTELAIVTVFKDQPAAVIRELQEIAGLVRLGECSSGWGMARHRIGRLRALEAVATDDSERERALDRALAWVRNVGLEFDGLEGELLDELFGDRGRLRLWPELRDVVLDELRAVVAKARAA